MGVAYILDDVRGKVAIKAIKCLTQLGGLAVVDLGSKMATRVEHVFKARVRRGQKTSECGVRQAW